METVNIVIPPTLRTLTTDELKELTVYTVEGRVGKEVLSIVLSRRYNTKRKINSVANTISQEDMMTFACELKKAGVTIDFSRTYLLLAEQYRSWLAIKQ